MLKVENLYCGYNGNDIIKDISFEAKSNEKICIIGPNGCGKTTLLRAISGMLDYRGNVFVNGFELKSLSRKDISRNIALMPQLSSVYFGYSVYEAVALGRYVHSSGHLFSELTMKDKDIVNECLEKTGVIDIKDKPITMLSGGQLQRVFLARVFAQEPDIILLDEPTNHLDLKYQLELFEFINEWIKNNNRTVISVMHDINIAVNYADSIILIDNGRIVFNNSSQSLLESGELDKVYNTNVNDFMKKSFSIWEKAL